MGGSFVILSTGLAPNAYSPNLEGNLSWELGGLNNSQGWDLVQLTLQMEVPDPFICFAFDFAFYSEEYPEYVGTQYNDTFIAEMGPPGAASTFVIVGSEVDAPNNIAFDSIGNVIDVNNVFGFIAASDTTYDGVVGPLGARSEVVPGTQIELVFSIMDLGDPIYDSAVFLDNFRWTMDPSESCQPGAVGIDDDEDGIPNFLDNCPDVANPLQEDSDVDDVGDACDSEGPTPNSNGLGGADDCNDGVDNDGDGNTDGVSDPFDNCHSIANPGQANTDGDQWGDACETADCIAVATVWPTPIGDEDCDGWISGNENFYGTLPLTACPATADPIDEDPDAWPPDFNDDRTVNILDLLLTLDTNADTVPDAGFKVSFGATDPDPLYFPRFDLNMDGSINMLDFVGAPNSFKSMFGLSCA